MNVDGTAQRFTLLMSDRLYVISHCWYEPCAKNIISPTPRSTLDRGEDGQLLSSKRTCRVQEITQFLNRAHLLKVKQISLQMRKRRELETHFCISHNVLYKLRIHVRERRNLSADTCPVIIREAVFDHIVT